MNVTRFTPSVAGVPAPIPHRDVRHADWDGMSTVEVDPVLASQPGTAQADHPVPCAARPSTGFRHWDGPCRCFFGGPAPEFAPVDAHLFLASAS